MATGEFRLASSFVPDPSVTGKNSLTLRLSEPGGAAVSGASFSIEPWMPAHGHGSSIVPQVVELGDGEYQSDDLIFTMPGTWEVRIAVDAAARHDYFVLTREVK